MMSLYGTKLLPIFLQSPCFITHTSTLSLPLYIPVKRMANNQPNITMLRDYRKGNWTVQETMVLIEAKKMDEERRMKRSETQTAGIKTSGGELRWKWVEDYCWRHGCLRSQNQCNDKWDNLMRDFKRVRDYQRRLLQHSSSFASEASSGSAGFKSYWETNKLERKERSLPSNMLEQVYDALVEVVERRSGGFVKSGGDIVGNVTSMVQTQAVLLQPVPNVMALQPPLMALPPVSQPSAAMEEQALCRPQLPTVECDTSEHSDSAAKRRKKEKEREGEGGSTSTTNNTKNKNNNNNKFGSELSKNASLIADAIQACDEREEARHKELLTLEQKKLQIDESKAEITRQGFNGLVDAINNLSNSILSLANSKQS